MSLLAVLLVAVGSADLARGRWARAGAYAAPLAVGAAAAVLALALAALGSAADLLLGLVVLGTLAGWVVLAERALARPTSHQATTAALAVLGLGVLAVVLASGAVDPVGGAVAGWLRWTGVPHPGGVSPDAALLLLGLLLVQVSTGNLLVRLVLGWGGAGQAPGARPADRLRGGRLLGPMERLFILGLGLAGQLTAAGIVIAAKGLIRWPELQAVRRDETDPGIDAVTEYFLVGSFVSWLLALASLALYRLA